MYRLNLDFLFFKHFSKVPAQWAGHNLENETRLEFCAVQTQLEFSLQWVVQKLVRVTHYQDSTPWMSSNSSGHPRISMLRALNRSDMRRQDSARSAQCTHLNLNISLLQASIQRSACCAHWTCQTCADKIQLEVRSIKALPDYFTSSNLHPRVGMLRALNRSDMCRQDSARSAQCTGSTLISSSSSISPRFLHSEPVINLKTRLG